MPGAEAKRRKHAARETRIVDGSACMVCGVPAGQQCREGALSHDPRRGTEDLRPHLGRVHRERRAAWMAAKHGA